MLHVGTNTEPRVSSTRQQCLSLTTNTGPGSFLDHVHRHEKGQKLRHNSKKAKGSRINEQPSQLGRNEGSHSTPFIMPLNMNKIVANEVVNSANDPSTTAH